MTAETESVSEEVCDTEVESESRKCVWFYVDSSGKRQGPFGEDEMVAWSKAGWFQAGLQVRSSLQSQLRAIGTVPVFQQFFAQPLDSGRAMDYWYLSDGSEQLTVGPLSGKAMAALFANGALSESTQVCATVAVSDGMSVAMRPTKDAFKSLCEMKGRSEFEAVMGSGKTEVNATIESRKSATEKLAESNWFYKNASGQLFGPWPFQRMQQWAQRGFFGEATAVRMGDTSLAFVPFSAVSKKLECFEVSSKRKAKLERRAEASEWLYVDDSGHIQGPLPRHVLTSWLRKDWLPPDTLCKRITDVTFATVRQSTAELLAQQSDDSAAVPISETQWYYVDTDNGKEQGPFRSAAMRQWFLAGYLPLETRVRRAQHKHFAAISRWIPLPEFTHS